MLQPYIQVMAFTRGPSTSGKIMQTQSGECERAHIHKDIGARSGQLLAPSCAPAGSSACATRSRSGAAVDPPPGLDASLSRPAYPIEIADINVTSPVGQKPFW